MSSSLLLCVIIVQLSVYFAARGFNLFFTTPLFKMSLLLCLWKTVYLVSLALGGRGRDVPSFSGFCTDAARNPYGSFSLRFFAGDSGFYFVACFD